MPITLEQVKHVATLARLDLPDGDLAQLAAEMGRILEHVAHLQERDTSGVPPTSSALVVAGIARDDAARPALSQDEAVRNAPATQGGMFLVPRVVDGGE